MSEDQIQAAFFQHVWQNYPQTQRLMWAVPNSAIGKIKTKEQAYRAQLMKATGLLAGVWDLHFFWNGKLYIFETKVPGGQLTVDRIDAKGKKIFGQKEWGERMAAHGAVRHIYHNLEEGVAIIEKILAGIV